MRLSFKKKAFIVIFLCIIGSLYYYNFQHLVPTQSIVIGSDTTFFSAPLNDSGLIDYAGAINRLDKIDPHDNSAVEFLNIFGCGLISPDLMYQHNNLNQIGIASYSLSTPCFKPLMIDNKRQKNVFSKEHTFFHTAWPEKDFPAVANWIKENDETIKLLIQASLKKGLYWPLREGKPLIDSELLPSRDLSEDFNFSFGLLRARAMNRLYDQDYSGAWSDILASIKLSTHLLRTRNKLTFLFGLVQLKRCVDSGLAVINDISVPIDQLQDIVSDLGELEKLPDLEKISEFEVRFMTLSMIMNMSQDHELLSRFMSFGGDNTKGLERYVDLNFLLKEANQRATKILAAEKTQPASARIKILNELSAQREKLLAELHSELYKKYLMWYVFEPSATKVSALTDFIFKPILLNTQLPQGDLWNVRDEHQQRLKLLSLAARVRAYQKENQKFPDQLTDLPSLASDTLIDLFSDSACRYKINVEEALIYSVGLNLTDDGGSEESEENNDISIIVKKTLP